MYAAELGLKNGDFFLQGGLRRYWLLRCGLDASLYFAVTIQVPACPGSSRPEPK